MTRTLTSQNFKEEVLNSPVPVLVDFWAEWCPPCRMIAPAIDDLATTHEGTFKVGKVDAEVERGLAAQYDVTALPTLLVFQGGQVARKFVGVQSQATLLAALKDAACVRQPA